MMSWPRTLFSRNLMLMVALILLGQIANALLFRELVLRPRTQRAGESTLRSFEALDSGLRGLPALQRRQFVEQYNATPERAVHADLTDRLMTPESMVAKMISDRLAERGGELVWRRDEKRMTWLGLTIDGESYWLNVRGLTPAREFPSVWMMGSITTALLAVLGAWLIQRHINRPLNELVQAARVLGQGARPPVLPESGPSEIATVAHGFNEMVASLAHNEQERALMLAGLSHDLRTPLAKMRLVTEMLGGSADAELLLSLNRNIDAMDRLLTQFLDFTRASPAGSWDHEPMAAADLNALARDALALGMQDSNHAVVLHAGALPPMMLRAQAVRRLVLNLVVNAQRHGTPPIEVVTGHCASGVWLEVRDRGPGIPVDRAEALKQPFVRGDEARGGPAGAGLGLAIVDRIARDHGARFDLLARAGGGLTARIEWPVNIR